MAYSETFNDHISNPRGTGEVSEPDAIAEQSNPVCGDRLRLSLKLRDDVICEARFLAYGCAPTLACGSALVELIQGTPLNRAAKLTRQDVVHGVGGLPALKSHAAALAIQTLHAALETLRNKG